MHEVSQRHEWPSQDPQEHFFWEIIQETDDS
jgi:hypothetical protein